MHVRLRRFGVWSAVVLVLMVAAGAAAPAQTPRVPEYELDREWPKLPLPNRWITGGLGGMCVDTRDHVYILNRQNVVEADLNAAQLAPPVIEFDPDGNVVQAWGNSDVIGDRLHDCHVDDEQNVWLVAAGTGVVQKYSRSENRASTIPLMARGRVLLSIPTERSFFFRRVSTLMTAPVIFT